MIGRRVLSWVGEPAAENTVTRRAHTSNPGAHAAQTHLGIGAEALIRGLHQIEREDLQRRETKAPSPARWHAGYSTNSMSRGPGPSNVRRAGAAGATPERGPR